MAAHAFEAEGVHEQDADIAVFVHWVGNRSDNDLRVAPGLEGEGFSDGIVMLGEVLPFVGHGGAWDVGKAAGDHTGAFTCGMGVYGGDDSLSLHGRFTPSVLSRHYTVRAGDNMRSV